MSSSPIYNSPALQPPPARKGPLLLLGVMIILFVALVTTLFRNYDKSFARRGAAESRPQAASGPASRGALAAEDSIPAGAGFTARNLEFEGNLTALANSDLKPLGMDDGFHRMAEMIRRIPSDRLSSKATLVPEMKDLLEHSSAYRGCVFVIRIVPGEINDHDMDLRAGRVRSWRTYGMLQRSKEEFAVFESLDMPAMKDWTLMRDVVEVEAVFIRTATYKNVKGKEVIVPYFIPFRFEKILNDSGGPTPGVLDVALTTKFGPYILFGILTFAVLTAWTFRRHARQTAKLEREHFYGMLRAKKRPQVQEITEKK